MERFAAGFGVVINQPARIPNTRRALAATELARDLGSLVQFRDAVMRAHWVDGADIEADETLGRIAEEMGLDAGRVLAAASDPAFLGRIDAQRAEAHGRGVRGIPTFFFGDVKIVGCQPYDVLAETARRVGVHPRTTTATRFT